MRIDDTVGPRVDPTCAGVLVVFNQTPGSVREQVAVLRGLELSLSPIQANGVAEVVKASSWDPESATLTVPPRTVAVVRQPTDARY
jgi:hypothetical protein